MSSAAAAQRRRSPVSLLERNRGRIVSAVVEVLADAGWSGLTFSSVARVAGLSPRPVQDRFPDRWALAVAAWEQVTGPALESALQELLDSVGLRPSSDKASDATSGRELAARASTVGPVSPGLRDRLASALTSAGLLDGVLESGSSSPGGPPDGRPFVALGIDPVDEMRQALGRALAAAGRADHLAVQAAGPSPEWLARALESFLRPDPVLRAATEILVMSQFDEGLSAAIDTTLGASVSQWCSPSRRDATDAARCAYLVSTAFGLLLARTRAGVAELSLLGEAELLFAALKSDATPSSLPQETAEHLGRFLDFDTGDPALDALLRATLEEVGRTGFDAATTAGIGRASGYSEGLLFARYPSKVEVFVDATRRQHAQNWRLNEAFQRGVIAAHGEGIAEAVVIREFQRPHLSLARAIHLEQVRLALHDERLRQVQWGELDALVAESTANDPTWHPAASPAHLHLSVAIGLGVACLPMLVPDAWQLPYDVVTIPLNEPGGPAAAPGS